MATKKVLLLVGTGANRIGGVEIFVRETALQLKEKRVETVAVFHAEPAPAVRRFFAIDGLTVSSLPDLTDNQWRKNDGLRSLLKQHRPDIVHWQFLDPLGPLPWLSWWYGASQVFFTNQGSCPEGFSPSRTPFLKRVITRIINWRLTGMFCVSDYLKGVMVASGRVVESRIHRIYNAVALPSLRNTVERGNLFRKTYNIPENAPIILQVSWLIPEKGLEDLLQAAKQVLSQYPEARFVIAGEGRDGAKLERLAQDLGIDKSIIWTGFLESPTQSGLYDAADIVCQLSRWEEAFGYVIAEGMSFSKPVIATSVGGIPEVVAHEKTGLLSPRRDPRSAAENICRLLADPALRRRLGEAGNRMVQEKFNVVDRVRELLSYYGFPADTGTGPRNCN